MKIHVVYIWYKGTTYSWPFSTTNLRSHSRWLIPSLHILPSLLPWVPGKNRRSNQWSTHLMNSPEFARIKTNGKLSPDHMLSYFLTISKLAITLYIHSWGNFHDMLASIGFQNSKVYLSEELIRKNWKEKLRIRIRVKMISWTQLFSKLSRVGNVAIMCQTDPERDVCNKGLSLMDVGRSSCSWVSDMP